MNCHLRLLKRPMNATEISICAPKIISEHFSLYIRIMKNNNIINIPTPLNRVKRKQNEIDAQVETICNKCKFVIDATTYYGWSMKDQLNGEYLFCSKNKLDEKWYTFINPVTGKRMRSIIYEKIQEGIYEWENVLTTEPAAKFEKCIEINDGKCSDYKRK